MARRKLSPSDILERLRVIDALAADGRPIADALRLTGVLPAEYEKWRNEFAGLLRTLGPLASAPPKVTKKLRRAGTDRPVRTVK
jgi:putative transposase